VSKVVFNPGDLVRVDRHHDFRLEGLMGVVQEESVMTWEGMVGYRVFLFEKGVTYTLTARELQKVSEAPVQDG
jgi:hypothetical protein